MRVTFGMMSSRIFDNLAMNSQRLMDAQAKAASGKRIQRPSDDVSSTGLAMSTRDTLSALEQYERNSNTALSHLTATNHELDNVVAILQDVRQIALNSANGTLTDEAREALALQLDQCMEALVEAGNARTGGEYIFAGSRTDTPPIVASGTASPPYTYQGDDFSFRIQISQGAYVDANVTADDVFNMGSSAAPGSPDVFETIRLLRQEVEAGDADAISARVADVTANMDNVIAARSQVGAKMRRLESTINTVQDSQVVFKELLSKTEDADIVEAVVELQTRQNLYQAALATSSKVLQISLADYLG